MFFLIISFWKSNSFQNCPHEEFYIIIDDCVEGLVGEFIETEVNFIIFNISLVYVTSSLLGLFVEPLSWNPFNAFPMSWLSGEMVLDGFKSIFRDIVKDFSVLLNVLVIIVFIDKSQATHI